MSSILNTIATGYRYFFYRAYSWQLGVFGKDDVPEFTGVITISLCGFLNAITVFLLVQIVSGVLMSIETEIIVLFIIVLFGINYTLLVGRGQLESISLQFAQENSKERRRGTIFCITYVALSCLLFVSAGLVRNGM